MFLEERHVMSAVCCVVPVNLNRQAFKFWCSIILSLGVFINLHLLTCSHKVLILVYSCNDWWLRVRQQIVVHPLMCIILGVKQTFLSVGSVRVRMRTDSDLLVPLLEGVALLLQSSAILSLVVVVHMWLVVIRICNGLLFERRVIIFAHVLRTTCDLRTF